MPFQLSLESVYTQVNIRNFTDVAKTPLLEYLPSVVLQLRCGLELRTSDELMSNCTGLKC